MPTSDASWSGKLRVISALELPDHHLLRADDTCYFLGEYTARAGYAHSTTNNLISNLKKPMSLRGTPQWKHKVRAVADAAAALASGLNPQFLTIVPIPPSKMAEDPEYDPRIAAIAQRIAPDADVREAIKLVTPRDAAHAHDASRDPNVLKAKLAVDTAQLAGARQTIALLDDVLTTGCSFRACKDLLQAAIPAATIIGVFVARRKPEDTFGLVIELDDF